MDGRLWDFVKDQHNPYKRISPNVDSGLVICLALLTFTSDVAYSLPHGPYAHLLKKVIKTNVKSAT